MCHCSKCTQNDNSVDLREELISPNLWPPNRMSFRTNAITLLLYYFTHLRESDF